MNKGRTRLPPGKTGLPILGETLSFLKNGFAFVAERASRYGPVFQTRLLGRKTAIIVGAAANGEFINSQNIQRSGAMLPHVQELFGGHSLPTLDGEQHQERKRLILAAFSRDALTSYIPTMRRILLESFNRWTSADRLRWVDEFKMLSLEVICTTVMGMEPGAKLEKLRADYELVGGGFAGLPIPLPGTAYAKARDALRRILATFEEIIEEHQLHPSKDGLSRILAATSGTGRKITVDEAKVELHHIIVAGLILFAWLSTAVIELDGNSEIKKILLEEIHSFPSEGPLTLELLRQMTHLQHFTMEVRRTSPVVPVFFGKARQRFQFEGHTIPAGWMVLWGIHSSHLQPTVFESPERFDPNRYSTARAEHQSQPHAYAPNGAGPETSHKCAGYEFAPLFLQIFTLELLKACDWEFVRPQDFGLDWKKIPPEPKDGLQVVVRPAS